jgi:hypothetical protein
VKKAAPINPLLAAIATRDRFGRLTIELRAARGCMRRRAGPR